VDYTPLLASQASGYEDLGDYYWVQVKVTLYGTESPYYHNKIQEGMIWVPNGSQYGDTLQPAAFRSANTTTDLKTLRVKLWVSQ
jgi:hypothetical protein